MWRPCSRNRLGLLPPPFFPFRVATCPLPRRPHSTRLGLEAPGHLSTLGLPPGRFVASFVRWRPLLAPRRARLAKGGRPGPEDRPAESRRAGPGSDPASPSQIRGHGSIRPVKSTDYSPKRLLHIRLLHQLVHILFHKLFLFVCFCFRFCCC